MNRSVLSGLALSTVVCGMLGCSPGPTGLLTDDPSFNRKQADIGIDAMKHFPYPADLAVAPLPEPMLAELDYGVHEIRIVPYGNKDWDDVEVWVNQSYVVPIAKLTSKTVKKIPFEVLYDAGGQQFPLKGQMIKTLEIRQGSTKYEVPTQLSQ